MPRWKAAQAHVEKKIGRPDFLRAVTDTKRLARKVHERPQG
jgi:hypothetical protein